VKVLIKKRLDRLLTLGKAWFPMPNSWFEGGVKLCFAHMVVPTCSSRATLPKIRGTDTIALVKRCCVAFPIFRNRSMAAMVTVAVVAKRPK
jgi:hypothetical protein